MHGGSCDRLNSGGGVVFFLCRRRRSRQGHEHRRAVPVVIRKTCWHVPPGQSDGIPMVQGRFGTHAAGGGGEADVVCDPAVDANTVAAGGADVTAVVDMLAVVDVLVVVGDDGAVVADGGDDDDDDAAAAVDATAAVATAPVVDVVPAVDANAVVGDGAVVDDDATALVPPAVVAVIAPISSARRSPLFRP